MKRYVKAARYREQASQYIKWLAAEAQLLADVCKVADDPQAVLEVVNNGGSLWEKKRAEEGDIVNLIKGLSKSVADLATEYLENDTKDKALPQVKEKTKNDWSSDSYVVVPADEAEFKDLNRICKELTDQFGIKWDTPLSGSWTGHNGVLDGVNVHVSIERDYEFDPSGKESSIQIYFQEVTQMVRISCYDDTSDIIDVLCEKLDITEPELVDWLIDSASTVNDELGDAIREINGQ